MADDGILIAGSGVRIPRIVYGTAWKKTRTEELVRRAIGLGFRGIDTACQPKHYDEAGVGAGVAACLNDPPRDRLRRTDLYLQTKFTPLSGHDPKRVPYDSKAPVAEQVAQSFETSLRNLRTDFVDCLVLHSPLSGPGQTAQAWQAMERVFDRGGARQLGLSNCYRLDELQALCDRARVKPAVVQNRFHAETNYDRDIRVFCRQRGIVYQSFWTLTANAHLLASACTVALTSRYQRTPAQVLFRYLTQQNVVPLTGTRTETHMREDLAIFDFELTGAELESITALLRSEASA